jgi:UDP-galactopyranose mutase
VKLYRALIIGSGVAGSTCARLLAEKGFHVDLLEQRKHVAGNCFDEINPHGHLLHKYGPHYFRTNSQKLYHWLSGYTDWIQGQYFVQARIKNNFIPLPISLASMEKLKGVAFTASSFEDYLQANRIHYSNPQNAQEQCLSLVGKELYELFFEGYTTKQWGLSPRQLAASVTARLPLRFNHDCRYPEETFQVLPSKGYTHLFQRLLDHENIHLTLGDKVSGATIKSLNNYYNVTIYTGPVDEFFNYEFGNLKYRSLEFVWRHYNMDYFQPCVQINYPNDHEFTRSVESKHITGMQGSGTTVCFEYPKATGEPYYPIPTKSQQDLYEIYKKYVYLLEEQNRPIYFLGRLAQYKYLNMDQVFLHAHNLAHKIFKRLGLPDDKCITET